MPTYVCDLCKKEFSQKGDLTKHKAKKTPCITIAQIQELTHSNAAEVDSKQKMKALFKRILDILRTEGIMGDKALKNMTSLLILKMLENKIGKEIDIDNYIYTFENGCPEKKSKLLELSRFTNLSKVENTDIVRNINELWKHILCDHPLTKKIFQCGIDIKHETIYKKIFKELIETDINLDDSDTLGDAYEEVIQDIMTGKVLGQFFTPPKVKKLIIDLIQPKLFDDGTIETCCDPTMGTGGFLLNYIKSISTQSKQKKIIPNWAFIKTALYGKEIVPETFTLAMANMLISTGHMFNLDNGDSIRDPIKRKFDIVLANPPFGIKGLKYDDFIPQVKEILPIKSDNAVSLFIQKIIHILNIGGRCAVVLPDGQDLFSKSAAYVAVREYLMKSCDLKEIIYMPAGIFDYTSIKTCVFYFVKKRDNVIKEIKKKGYTFAKTLQTKSVKFYDFNSEKEEKHLLIDVPIQDIVSNSYSLNYAEYMKEEEEEYDEGIVVKTLGDICDFLNGKKRNAIEAIDNGNYKFITCSIQGYSYLNEYDFEDEALIINSINGSGKCMIYCANKYSTTNNNFHFKVKTKEILNRYIYYYLYYNIHLLEDGFIGANQKKISKEYISNIKIPIPSLERQHEIVSYIDFIEKTNKISQEKINDLKLLNEYCLKNQKMFGENEIKTLGEVCNFDIGGTPSRIKNEYYDNGTNLWVSVRELNRGYIYDTKEKITDLGVENSSVKLFPKETILFSFKLSIGKTAIAGNSLYTNEAIAGIISKNNDALGNKYLYQYLTINDFSNLGTGILGNGSLNKKSLAEIKISFPSLERQKEIVEYCEYNDKMIQQLEKEMDNNKLQAKQCIDSILKIKE